MDLFAAAAEFAPPGSRVLDVRIYGGGNVNDTFLVSLDTPAESHLILQRLNPRVFPRPALVMANLATITQHVRRRLAHLPLGGRRWEMPRVLPTRHGRDHLLDPEGSFWRALSFIAGAETHETIKDLAHAGEVGYALGRFHHLLSDLAPVRLADTLPGFHITPRYLAHYDAVHGKSRGPVSPEVKYCREFIEARRRGAAVLEEARVQGKLHLRPIHGDPKVDNVMLDAATGRAVGLIDLDTVKPGLVHYDLGDCLRSGANPLGEETGRWEAVRFEPDLGRTILEGYLAVARGFLTPADLEYLYPAVHLIAFELGLRFFTDYLEGNVYFKAHHRQHNLVRALVQFKLAESIESQEGALRAILRDLR